jgi:hypothetical protein
MFNVFRCQVSGVSKQMTLDFGNNIGLRTER